MTHTRSADVRRAGWALVLLASAVPVAAQPYEFAYGPAGTVERGMRGVTPVAACFGGGSIAVGTTGSGPTGRVYVVRTTAAGAPIWERVYDVGPAAGFETGESITEVRDGSGFVVAGTTRASSTALTDAFLMKVSCDGWMVWWSHVYHSPGSEGALNVVEARSGDAAFGTARGDLIVSGFAPDPTAPTSGNRIGLLFRTRADGMLLWNQRYILPGLSQFSDVLEARPLSTLTGDVVASGRFTPAGTTTSRAYVVRVSGNHGHFTGAPHCAAAYTAGSQTRFEAVAEQRVWPHATGLVLVGTASSAATSNDVYVVRTTADPCAVQAQALIGDAAAAPIGIETGLDVREVPYALPLSPAGALAITGAAGNTWNTDAFLLLAEPFGLKPIPGPGHIYGNHSGGRESGQSVALAPNGFFIAGSTNTDFAGVGDPGDMYLVGPDVNGRTRCALGWNPPYVPQEAPPTRVNPDPSAFLQQVRQWVRVGGLSTPFNVCP